MKTEHKATKVIKTLQTARCDANLLVPIDVCITTTIAFAFW